MTYKRLVNLFKEANPDFKKCLEEQITIKRETFDEALADVFNIGPYSTESDLIEVIRISKNLWEFLRKYHV